MSTQRDVNCKGMGETGEGKEGKIEQASYRTDYTTESLFGLYSIIRPRLYVCGPRKQRMIRSIIKLQRYLFLPVFSYY